MDYIRLLDINDFDKMFGTSNNHRSTISIDMDDIKGHETQTVSVNSER